MEIKAIKTGQITANSQNLVRVLDQYMDTLPEKSVLAISSKIVSLCEGRVVPLADSSKEKLAREEADYYIPAELNKYHRVLTIKYNTLIMAAGVDSRNTNGYYVLPPENPQKTAEEILTYLKQKFSISNLGIIITDSHTVPLRQGSTGVAIAYCGFDAVNFNPNTKDIFGNKMTKNINVADSLAVAANFVMGETREQTPLAIISNIPKIKFSDTAPSAEDIKKLFVPFDDDVYNPVLKSAPWKKGG